MWDLTSQAGIKPMSLSLEAQSFNHWAIREVPYKPYLVEILHNGRAVPYSPLIYLFHLLYHYLFIHLY